MTAVFAKYHVSVAQIIQKQAKPNESAEIVVITGKVREGDFRTAMEELSGRSFVHKISSMLRYMENSRTTGCLHAASQIFCFTLGEKLIYTR